MDKLEQTIVYTIAAQGKTPTQAADFLNQLRDKIAPAYQMYHDIYDKQLSTFVDSIEL